MRRLIASWFGSGFILQRLRGSLKGSGTLTSALTFPIALAVGEIAGAWGQIAALVIVTAAGLWAAGEAIGAEGDAPWIVIDEAAGMFLAVIGLTFSPAALAAFLVFRAADIGKDIFIGVGAAERRLPGAWGVMGDDLAAGLYGLAAGHAVRVFL